MTKKDYIALVQRLVFHDATDALLEDISMVLAKNANFDLEKYWDYVRVCRKYKEDL